MGNGSHDFISARFGMINNKHFSKQSAPVIYAYVEDSDDKDFWNEIFKKYFPAEIQLKFTRGYPHGKEAILKHSDKTGEDFIICLDSDLDYLLPKRQSRSKVANTINNHVCIFQTYTYAIENYQCFADSLNEICKKNSKHDPQPGEEFDFKAFFDKYSQKIYEPFIYFLYFINQDDENTLPFNKFKNLIKIDNNQLKDAKDIDDLNKKLDEIIANMVSKLDILLNLDVDNEKINEMKEKIIKRIENSSNTYLFIKGHTLLDFVVMPLVTTVVNIYQKKEQCKIKEIYENGSKQCEDRLRQYENISNRMTIENRLKENKDFHRCELINKIRDDISLFLMKYYPSYLGKIAYTHAGLPNYSAYSHQIANQTNESDRSDSLSERNDYARTTKTVFISYSSKDKDVANDLAKKLHSIGVNVIIDDIDTMPLDSIKAFISESIEKSDFTLSIVSKNSLLSSWFAREIIEVFYKERNYPKKIFIPCPIDDSFYDRYFVDEVYTSIEEKIAEIDADIIKRREKDRGINDLINDLAIYRDHKQNIDKIVERLRSYKCIDISGNKLEHNFSKIIETINRD